VTKVISVELVTVCKLTLLIMLTLKYRRAYAEMWSDRARIHFFA
jgi:hypothetical protein